MRNGFLLPGFTLASALWVLLFWLGVRVTRSRLGAVLGVVMVIGAGGLGFWRWVEAVYRQAPARGWAEAFWERGLLGSRLRAARPHGRGAAGSGRSARASPWLAPIKPTHAHLAVGSTCGPAFVPHIMLPQVRSAHGAVSNQFDRRPPRPPSLAARCHLSPVPSHLCWCSFWWLASD